MNFLELSEIEQKKIIEALIFSADEPQSLEQLKNLLVLKPQSTTPSSINTIELEDLIKSSINIINSELVSTNRPFTIIERNNTYQYAISPEYGELLQQVSRHKIKKRLSQAALEVLAIIAYKQPISKPEIEQIRGINSNEVVNSLLDKDFIQISGKSENIGKSFLYATTNEFLQAFGMNSIEELPALKEFAELSEFENNDLSIDKDSNLEELSNVITDNLGFVKIIHPKDMVYSLKENNQNETNIST
ncbi:MAG TPA: SMC-Scp complex subunit ScpB [Candidatus Kapabacteria bacterium]|nr:SMC-Scp complex subunit ScpB [Candidatus Kapabacteria bacterium]